jgi:hypothetical protein
MKRALLWLTPLTLLIVLAALYFQPETQKPPPKPASEPAPTAEAMVRHRVESIEAPDEPLPPLAESDGPLRDALAKLFGHEMPAFVYLDRIVHRIVATLDNLPRDYVAPQLIPAKPAPGLPLTSYSGEELILSPKNADRYRAYVQLIDAVPTSAAVALYARFYPLFQEQYENLGYPDKYFNDRLVEVIDHLLATPEVEGPLRLVQPRVLYEYADPKLENLSAGQKILLRMGRANAGKVKTKLQEVRRALVSMAPVSAGHAANP